jgi:hypothetical protein
VALPEGVVVQCGPFFYYPNRFITQAPCHRTPTLIAPSLKVRTLARIPQQPCNGIIP